VRWLVGEVSNRSLIQNHFILFYVMEVSLITRSGAKYYGTQLHFKLELASMVLLT